MEIGHVRRAENYMSKKDFKCIRAWEKSIGGGAENIVEKNIWKVDRSVKFTFDKER